MVSQLLDMCAAPGSKTFQLLEALHAVPTTPEATAGIDPAMKLPKGEYEKDTGPVYWPVPCDCFWGACMPCRPHLRLLRAFTLS